MRRTTLELYKTVDNISFKSLQFWPWGYWHSHSFLFSVIPIIHTFPSSALNSKVNLTQSIKRIQLPDLCMKIIIWATCSNRIHFLFFPTCLAGIFILNTGNSTINSWPWEASIQKKPKRQFVFRRPSDLSICL